MTILLRHSKWMTKAQEWNLLCFLVQVRMQVVRVQGQLGKVKVCPDSWLPVLPAGLQPPSLAGAHYSGRPTAGLRNKNMQPNNQGLCLQMFTLWMHISTRHPCCGAHPKLPDLIPRRRISDWAPRKQVCSLLHQICLLWLLNCWELPVGGMLLSLWKFFA